MAPHVYSNFGLASCFSASAQRKRKMAYGHRPGEPPFLLWHGCTNAAGRHCSWMAMAACKLAASAVVRAGPLHAIARQTSNASRQGTSHFLGRNWGLMVAS